jgi:hypothetical protein
MDGDASPQLRSAPAETSFGGNNFLYYARPVPRGAGRNVNADQYLLQVLAREAVDDAAGAPLRRLEAVIYRLCLDWAGPDLVDVAPAGAFEKGTANLSGVPIDFLATVHAGAERPVGALYEDLFLALELAGHEPRERGVAIGIRLGAVPVDIIPAKRRPAPFGEEHQLHSSRIRRPLFTNLGWHRHEVESAGRIDETRIIKLWRDQHGLDFPSLYLELTVIAALRGKPHGTLAANVWLVLGYLASLFVARAVIDPANANNIVSDELGAAEKQRIRAAALLSRSGRPWQDIVA